MAIIIPSKNIYDKQNPKVRDNVIERIEVGAVEVVHDNEYETPVYNESIKSGWNTDDIEEKAQQAQQNTSSESITKWARAVSYISLKPTYLQAKIFIPKTRDNKFINKIYHSYKEDETTKEKVPDIKITVFSDKYEGNATADGYYDFKQDDNGTGATVSNITTNYSSTPSDVSSPLEPIFSYTHDNDVLDATANLDYELKETILTPTFDDTTDANNYIIEFNCLVGYEQVLLGGETSGTSIFFPPSEGELSLSGTCIKYIPKQVEITIYGNKIGIELTDKTIYMPEMDATSKKVHSIDRNELMQTSNYFLQKEKDLIENIDYTITNEEIAGGDLSAIKITLLQPINTMVVVEYEIDEEKYKSIIPPNQLDLIISFDARGYGEINLVYTVNNIPQLQNLFNQVQKMYKNGKETATIRCSISDYFSEKYDRSEHIDIADKRFKVVQEPPNDRYDAPPSYGIFETKYRIINIVSFDGKSISGDEQIVVEQISDTKLKIYFNQAGANIDYVDLRLEVQDAILINNSSGRMSFKLYDQVIPMVYGADGKDYPMSKYNDGSPKIFQVLGTKVYYDGAVWQELSLQEI